MENHYDETQEEMDDLSIGSSIIAFFLFILIAVLCGITYICLIMIKTTLNIILFPLCLLFFSWIEYPLWKEYHRIGAAGNFFSWFWKRMYDKNT